MESIQIDKIKNEVAVKNGYENWGQLKRLLIIGKVDLSKHNEYENEVISEAAKQVAEATKQSCAEEAKSEIVKFKLLNGVRNATYSVIDKESILNAPIPEII